MKYLSLADVAKKLKVVPATIRHHLRKSKLYTRSHRDWILTEDDLPKLVSYIEAARAAKGFQPGNQAAKGGKPAASKQGNEK